MAVPTFIRPPDHFALLGQSGKPIPCRMLTLPVEIMPPAETTINRVLANRSFRLANSTTEKMGDHNRIPSAAVELIRQLETLGLFDRIIAEKS